MGPGLSPLILGLVDSQAAQSTGTGGECGRPIFGRERGLLWHGDNRNSSSEGQQQRSQ
jgi:hypothetical protein